MLWAFIAGWLILCLFSLRLDGVIWHTITVRNTLFALFIIAVARIADRFISARILEEIESQTVRDIYHDQYGQKNRSNITRVVHYILVIIVSILVIRSFDIDYDFQMPLKENVTISISGILTAVLILLVVRLIIWILINLFLYGWYKRERIDLGKQYAYNQLLSYVFYFIALVFALQYVGIDLTLLLAGAGLLLVGVGIALQQVISDFFSGLVILFERSVEVGDFLDFGDMKGTVKKIGLRASIVQTIEQKDVIIPNSKIVNENVTNWSSTRVTTLFKVQVGVAYGSDTAKVKGILLKAASEVREVKKSPPPFVRFENFGDSSLDFSLLFFSDQVEIIEIIKSDIRFRIDALFRENGVEIPFPQRTVWFHDSSKEPGSREPEA